MLSWHLVLMTANSTPIAKATVLSVSRTWTQHTGQGVPALLYSGGKQLLARMLLVPELLVTAGLHHSCC